MPLSEASTLPETEHTRTSPNAANFHELSTANRVNTVKRLRRIIYEILSRHDAKERKRHH